MIVMYSIVTGTCHSLSHQSNFVCAAGPVLLADCLPVVVSVADPMRNVSWMLFPGGIELGTQVKTGS